MPNMFLLVLPVVLPVHARQTTLLWRALGKPVNTAKLEVATAKWTIGLLELLKTRS